MKGCFLSLCVVLWAAGFPPALAAGPAYEEEPIRYSDTEADTPLTRIINRIGKGEPLLQGETGREVLIQLLGLLDIPKESQVLVYSKTSAQNRRISPRTPRAIYFSDNAYVGWVRGGGIETITFDQKLGPVFHRVHLNRPRTGGAPDIVRDSSCLDCHGGFRTRGHPGVVARSVYPSESGHALLQAGTFTIDHSSPISERWGGWYVTGDPGNHSHLGNIIATAKGRHDITIEKIETGPIKDLSAILDSDAYPGGGSSDIVALMVFEDQLAVHNALVRANHITQLTEYRHRQIQKLYEDPEDAPLNGVNQRMFDSEVENVVRTLLFADEFLMENDGPEGATGFLEAFKKNAQPNSEGRSLKDFRLYERLFKYRCSYAIYSSPFDHLPTSMKSRVIRRLHQVLTSPEVPEGFEYLSDTGRERTAQILSETLQEWPK